MLRCRQHDCQPARSFVLNIKLWLCNLLFPLYLRKVNVQSEVDFIYDFGLTGINMDTLCLLDMAEFAGSSESHWINWRWCGLGIPCPSGLKYVFVACPFAQEIWLHGFRMGTPCQCLCWRLSVNCLFELLLLRTRDKAIPILIPMCYSPAWFTPVVSVKLITMSTVGPLNRTKCEFLISVRDDMVLRY